jgi:polysaccharide pyruvyl transferase WcaK-like protein
VSAAPRVLLLGYLGARNTGAEMRLLTILDDVRAVFGPDAAVTVATASGDHTRQVVTESATLQVVEIPHVFPVAVARLVRRHDVVLLVEGSTFKDSWSSALLYLFLWAAYVARRASVACVAYAVDAGRLGRFNRVLARRVVEGMDLVVVRSPAARTVLREGGVTRALVATTDTAFAYRSRPPRRPRVRPVLGVAPVNFHVWPVRPRLWGPAAHCYHWPYYFSWDEQRAVRTEDLVQAWAGLVTRAVRQHGLDAQLIAMEALDDGICGLVLAALPDDVRARTTTCSASDESPTGVVARLRSLDYLVTSRYHAAVLSMEAHVPQMAVFHDERLLAVYREAGLEPHAHPHDTPDLPGRMQAGLDALLRDAPEQRRALRQCLTEDFLPRCARNREVLREWAAAHGLCTVPALPVVPGARTAGSRPPADLEEALA